jgi:predicted Zn-dependent peptidase
MTNNIQITELDNGLRVATDRIDHVHTASLGAWTKVGSRHEEKPRNGVAHFLEHMVFKGTENRSSEQISEQIESVGGRLNAYTSRDQTAYYARILKEDIELGIDLIADVLQHPRFDKDEMERERGVILQEIAMYRDSPDDVAFDHAKRTAFPGQALGRPILGTQDSVSAMSPDDIRSFIKQHYSGPNMVLAATGRVDHDQVVELAQEYFCDLPKFKQLPGEEGYDYHGGQARNHDPSKEQVNLILGFPGVGYFHDDFYVETVLALLLGSGMSSRLFKEVREKRGLVYTISSFNQSYRDGGFFGIHAGTGPELVAELLPVVADELIKIGNEISDDELARAKTQARARILMGMESTSGRCRKLASQLLIYDRPVDQTEIIDRVNAVTMQDVLRHATWLFAQKPTLSAVGPLDHLMDVSDLQSRLSG